MNEQLDEINSALSKLGYKAPSEINSNPDVQNLTKIKSELSSMISQLDELKQSPSRRQVFEFDAFSL